MKHCPAHHETWGQRSETLHTINFRAAKCFDVACREIQVSILQNGGYPMIRGDDRIPKCEVESLCSNG